MANGPLVAVIGSFMMDLVTRVERRPAPGETVVGLDFGIYPGGKGVNQAVTARRMGARVEMVGRIGADPFGDTFASVLAEERIGAAHVARDPQAGTGVGMPVLDTSGQNSIIIIPRANWWVTPADIERARPVIERADAILLQNEIPHEANLAASRLGRQLGKRVIYNPAPARVGSLELLPTVDLITPNETEAFQLTGIRPGGEREARQAALALRELGARAVAITLGAMGCYWADGSGGGLVPAFRVDAVDTTGAGDAFNGALTVGLSVGMPLREAAVLGTAAGSLAVTRVGAIPSMPTRAEVAELWRRCGEPPIAPELLAWAEKRDHLTFER